jgi:hypothetical protein
MMTRIALATALVIATLANAPAWARPSDLAGPLAALAATVSSQFQDGKAVRYQFAQYCVGTESEGATAPKVYC